VVVEGVHNPGLGAVLQMDLGGVDLPQIVGDLPLEALQGLGALLRLVGHQVVAPEGLVDGRDRRRGDPGALKLRSDPACSPPRMVLPELADLDLEVGVDLARRGGRTPGSGFETDDALRLVPPLVLVEGVPGDPSPPTYLRHRLAGSLRLEQDLQPKLRHAHHPQAHAHLPRRRG
jgi:hypothetical protein